MSDNIVDHYSEALDEETTLDVRIGPFEYELISRDVGCEQRIVIDVGRPMNLRLPSKSN